MDSKFNAVQGDAAIPATFREVKIGDTIYRLTSRFEGNKDLDATLQRLAIKNIINCREEISVENH